VFTDVLLAGSNHNLLQLNGLKNGVDNATINNATVSAEIHDENGAIAGMAWPAQLSYVAGSDGSYQLLLDSALNLIDDKYYTIKMSVDAGGLVANWEKFIKATNRI